MSKSSEPGITPPTPVSASGSDASGEKLGASSRAAMARPEQRMGRHTAAELARWVKRAEEKTFRADRLNIGPRLILCFLVIILSMLTGDAVVLWQFHLVRDQAERLNGIDRKLVAVLRVHTSLLAFHDRLNELAQAQDEGRLVTEAGPLRTAVLEDTQRAKSALRLLPSDLQRDPTFMPTLLTVQSALPSQLEAITSLATAGDWGAVRLRLANQVRPLESLTAALAEKVEHEAAEEQARTELNIRRVEQRAFLTVPLTALFTLLMAATLGLAITRSITQPLARLVEGSRALARGEFQYQVAIRGGDELAHLGEVFNDTAARLRDLYATLQSSEDRLRLVIETIPAHVWSARPDGSVDFTSQRWLEFTGLSSANGLVGWDWSSVFHPDDLPRIVDAWREALAAGAGMESEARLRRADGEYRWFLVRAVPLRGKTGNILKWYGVLTDIEDRKQAEEALRRAQTELAHATRIMTMGELAASIAHEVNQPLSGVVVNGNACLRWLAGDSPNLDEAREAVRRIVRDGKRAGEVIARIRALATKTAAAKERLDMNEAIREVMALAGDELRKNGVAVRTEFAPDLLPVLGDRVQLQQVVLNLVMNGIEAMSSVQERPRGLSVRTQNDDADQVRVTVQDSGIGLDPQSMERIFDAFYTTKHGGMGMGLSISRSIIQNHGGKLWAVVNDGPGMSVQFTIPKYQ